MACAIVAGGAQLIPDSDTTFSGWRLVWVWRWQLGPTRAHEGLC
jgi:hypothetical protein